MKKIFRFIVLILVASYVLKSSQLLAGFVCGMIVLYLIKTLFNFGTGKKGYDAWKWYRR